MQEHPFSSQSPDEVVKALWRQISPSVLSGPTGRDFIDGAAGALLLGYTAANDLSGSAAPRPTGWRAWWRVAWDQLRHESASQVEKRLRTITARIRAEGGPPEFIQACQILLEGLKRHPSATRAALLDWAGQFDLGAASERRLAGEALSLLVSLSSSKLKSDGSWVTPDPVARLIAEVAAPQSGESIYDPCFGVGNILAACVHYVRKTSKGATPSAIYGSELQGSAFAIGYTQLLMAGAPVHLRQGDTLEHGDSLTLFQRQFDVVVANLPWGVKYRGNLPSHSAAHTAATANVPGAGRYQSSPTGHFEVSSNTSELLLLQHIMGSLAQGGRAVVCVPEGILFHQGAAQRVREKLLNDFAFEGVIALEAGSFSPSTNIQTSLLVFRRAAPLERVRLLQAPPLVEKSSEGGAHKGGAATPAQIARQFRMEEEAADVWALPTSSVSRLQAPLVARRPASERTSPAPSTAPDEDSSRVPSVPLEKVAAIYSGVSRHAGDTVPFHAAGPGWVGWIRSGEMSKRLSENYTPARALIPEVARKYSEAHRIQEGDILIDAVAAPGQDGQSRGVNRAPRAVAGMLPSGVFVVRPGEEIDPFYLLALLRSRSFTAWFEAHTADSFVRRLSKSDLLRFPVPLPPRELQEEVARAWASPSREGIEALLDRMTRGRSDSLTQLLQGMPEVRDLLRAVPLPSPSGGQATLERIARPLQVLRNHAVHGGLRINDAHFLPWAMSMAQAAAVWNGLSDIPEGSARLLLLERARASLAEAEGAARGFRGEGSSPSGDVLRLTQRLSHLNNSLIRSIATRVDVSARLSPDAIEVDAEQRAGEVALILRNDSPLPLRGLHLKISKAKWEQAVPFLAEKCEVSFGLRIPLSTASDSARRLSLTLQWHAERLDGHPVEGTVGLALLLRPVRPAEAVPAVGLAAQGAADAPATGVICAGELGSNPYITGKPVPGDRKDMLLGREDILKRIGGQLSTTHRANVLVIEGNRRAGKTSLMERLTNEPPPGWVVASCSLDEDGDEGPSPVLQTRELFQLWTWAIIDGVRKAGTRLSPLMTELADPDPATMSVPMWTLRMQLALKKDFEAGLQPFEVFQTYIKQAVQAVAPQRVLLLIDEFDALAQSVEVGATKPQVLRNLRHLLQTQPEFTVVIGGSQRLKKLTQSYWSALFGLGERIPVGRIGKEAAQALVTRPVAGRLAFTDEARDEIVRGCARHPYLIQAFCSLLFAQADQFGERSVTIESVRRAEQEFLAAHGFFPSLWQDAETERRRFILALCAGVDGAPGRVTLDFIQAKVEEHGISAARKELGDDLTFLRELDVLEHHDSTYWLAVPLLGRWIKSQRDYFHQACLAQAEAISPP